MLMNEIGDVVSFSPWIYGTVLNVFFNPIPQHGRILFFAVSPYKDTWLSSIIP